ncbi:uncharacterized protein VTP21DRAFT_11107 [Calcarisporiella thermophila]|uniref:uncharacterized protein n=1 Tax=Calcarisporiella thermophila TaxID=911321 RepID=UPI003743DFC6
MHRPALLSKPYSDLANQLLFSPQPKACHCDDVAAYRERSRRRVYGRGHHARSITQPLAGAAPDRAASSGGEGRGTAGWQGGETSLCTKEGGAYVLFVHLMIAGESGFHSKRI